jgi:hypothetical protein
MRLITYLLLIACAGCASTTPATQSQTAPTDQRGVEANPPTSPPTQQARTELKLKEGMTPAMEAILRGADKLVLFSVDPRSGLFDDRSRGGASGSFRGGHQILGSVEVKDAREREQLVKAWEDGLGGDVSMCWAPRHGIRAIRGDEALEIIVCFQCSHFYADTATERSSGAIRSSTATIFNRILKAAGVPLSPR